MGAIGLTTFVEYERALRDSTIYPIARLEFLDENGYPDFEITDDFISDGTLTCNKQNGVRRTASITLSNLDQKHGVNVNKIWIGQQVRLSAGIRLPSGEDYLFPQGIFYITDPEETYQPTAKTIRLNLIDKWAGLDGTVGGTLDGIYQINPGDDLFVAAQQLLQIDRGNGHPLDIAPPILDSAYKDKVSYVLDAYGNATETPFTNAPYTLRTEAESTYADVLLGINTMLVSTCGYDNTGHLRFTYANAEIDDAMRPIAWEFSVDEMELYGATFTHNFNEMCNDVRIVGATVNGIQVSGRATNNNPASDCCVARVGYHTFTETQSKFYTYEQCNELARYYLRKKTIVQKQVAFTTTPIYHLNEDMLVSLLRPEKSGVPELYLVTGFTLPLGGTGAMTINAVSVSDIDIFDKWDAPHSLTVLSSHLGSLVYEYGESLTANLTNPYTIVEIPENTLVTFTVNVPSGGTGCSISDVRLNGVAIDHTGQSCSFNMPNYDSKITFVLTTITGNNLTYSYDGTCSESTLTEGSHSWKVIKFTTSGTLTLNEAQVKSGVVVDVFVRGAGGGSSAEAAGANGYQVFENSVDINSTSIAITVGDGGAYDEDRGRTGGVSSWGALVQAPGGSGAGSASGKGGNLGDIFGLIEDTQTGAGGTVGNAGANGAVWIRIAN